MHPLESRLDVEALHSAKPQPEAGVLFSLLEVPPLVQATVEHSDKKEEQKATASFCHLSLFETDHFASKFYLRIHYLRWISINCEVADLNDFFFISKILNKLHESIKWTIHRKIEYNLFDTL